MSANNTEKTMANKQFTSRLLNVKNVITVEPVILSLCIPFFLLTIAIQNLSLEKACRVNLALSDSICDAMMDKAKFQIHCAEEENYFVNYSIIKTTISSDDKEELLSKVCWAEKESQKLVSSVNAYTSPIESIFGILIVLFAGNWSDKHARRIPCIILPLFGEIGAHVSALMGAIFMKEISMESSRIPGNLFPGLFGGFALALVGVFSYLSDITSEENRTFRFGVIAQMSPVVSMVALPFSGLLYQTLGYIKLLSLGISVNLLGILYITFCLNESNPKPKTDIKLSDDTEENSAKSLKKPLLCDIFNYKVLTDCYAVVAKRRRGYGNRIILFILILTIFGIGPDYGEFGNEYFFVRTKLNWEALQHAPYAAYSSASQFVGTVLMIVGLSKYLKISDSMIGIISSIFSTISRIVFIFVSTTFMLYVGRTLDMFTGVKNLVTKSIVSTIIESSETGQMYSLIGVLENVSKFIFIPIYFTTYRQTVSIFPNAYFIWSLFSLLIVTGFYILIYIYVIKHSGSTNVEISPEIDLSNVKEMDTNLDPLLKVTT